MRVSRSVQNASAPAGSVVESTMRQSTHGCPVVFGYPMALTITGAGLRSSAVSRPPAVWPPSSTSTSMPCSRMARSSAASFMAPASTQSSHMARKPRVMASLPRSAEVEKATSFQPAGVWRMNGSAKKPTEWVRRSPERMPMRSGRSGSTSLRVASRSAPTEAA